MFTAGQYQLLDFGKGRKLEQFGPFVLDRPSPSAGQSPRAAPALWKTAHARFRRTKGESGRWLPKGALSESWTVRHKEIVLQLKPTDFGHLGVFPEQADNWDWIARQVRQAEKPIRVLNLFAYTGGATIAAAASGAEVVHVDAAKNTVQWARRNAVLSGQESAPVRWIAEDAKKFVRRELRRGCHYDAVILDPPSYGHGPKGESWKIARDLMPLLSKCGELTRQRRVFFLLTCHSPEFAPSDLEAMLADAVFGHCQSGARARPLSVPSKDHRLLPSGMVARWPE
ncbi:MAG: class I SAM-dependent methyltransferase [Pirellulaceae bacterium]